MLRGTFIGWVCFVIAEREEIDVLLDLEVFILDARLVFLHTPFSQGHQRQETRSGQTLMRRTATARSAGVRNHAFVGESGKRNLVGLACQRGGTRTARGKRKRENVNHGQERTSTPPHFQG